MNKSLILSAALCLASLFAWAENTPPHVDNLLRNHQWDG